MTRPTTEPQFASEMQVELVDAMGTDMSIAHAAWVSTQAGRSDDQGDEKHAAGLINYLIKHRHGSPFEHTALTFFVEAPLFVFREWHRHRVGFSYNELSGRYSQLMPKFYVPGPSRPVLNVGSSARPEMAPGDQIHKALVAQAIEDVSRRAYGRYEALLEVGVAKEVARMVLPVNTFSAMYVTCNARSLMHFLSLRTHSNDAQFVSYPMFEIEQCARSMEEHFAAIFPLTYTAFIKNRRVSP